MTHKLICMVWLWLASSVVIAEDLVQESIPGAWRFSYEEVPISTSEKMGLVGAHYDLNLIKKLPELFIGLGGYGSATGEEGGFFTAGVTASWRKKIAAKYLLDTGIHFGGGGGSDRAFPGGGEIVRSHLMLERKFQSYSMRLGVAHTDFPNSRSSFSSNTHFVAGLRLTSDAWKNIAGEFKSPGLDLFKGKTHRLRITSSALYYIPDDTPITRRGGYTNVGTSTNRGIPLLGIQIDRYFNDHFFTMLEAYGAGGGGADGYATFFTGLGYSHNLTPVYKALDFEARMLVGLAGDGRLDTGGGLMLQPMVGLRLGLFPGWSAKAMVGRTVAVDGRFRATSVELGLSWDGEKPRAGGSYARRFSREQYKVVKWLSSISNKTYRPTSGSRKTNGSVYKKYLQLIGLEVSRPLNDFVSLSGSTHWAYSGDIGSYAEGMLGFKVFPLAGKKMNLKPVIQYDVGVAGGGDVDVGRGVLQQFKLGLRYQYSPKISVDMYVGRTQSLNKSFVADTMNIQVNWNHLSLFRK